MNIFMNNMLMIFLIRAIEYICGNPKEIYKETYKETYKEIGCDYFFYDLETQEFNAI